VPPLEQILDVLLSTVLPPAVLAAVLTGVALLLARWHDALGSAGCALAVAGGIVLGCSRDNQLQWIPEAAGWTWLLWATLAALATDVVARMPRVPPGVGWALRGMVSAQAGWLLTPVGLRDAYFWSPIALGALVLAEWALLEQLGRADRRGLVPLMLGVAANVGALVLIYAAEARFGFVAMILLAALGGMGVAALALGRETNGAAAATAVLLPGLMVSGQQDTFSDVPAACFALVALSPLALAPSLLPAWRRYQKKGLGALQLVLVLLPLIGALVLAAQTGSLNPNEEEETPARVAHPAELAQSRGGRHCCPFAA
jgi:hypothetical protein